MKVVVWTAGVSAVAGVGVLSAEWMLVRRTPAWYVPQTRTPAQQASAARNVEDTLIRLHNWSAVHAVHTATSTASSAGPSTYPLTFTDAQLDAFFDKWADFQNRRSAVERYVHDPRLVVLDGHLIVVGEIRETGLVVSLFVQPAVSADGRLRLTIDRVVAGVVPVPDAFFASQRAALERTLAADLPAAQAGARLNPDGLANGAAATAAMNEMLLAMLRGQPAEPVVFVPVSASGTSSLLPVRISSVSAANHVLRMNAEAMAPDDRRELLDRIKVPDAGK
jgi:hypothetical protein